MDLIKIANERHVVRHFDGKPLKNEDINTLNRYISDLNNEYGLNMQLMVDEPLAFGGEKAKISNITGCVNYLVINAKPTEMNKIYAGYVGEEIVLIAQSLGINSCWAALTYDKQPQLYKFNPGEEIIIAIALGYGLTKGKPHTSKDIKDVCVYKDDLPNWFIEGVKAALLAPTGRNQQGFKFELIDEHTVKATNESLCKEVDLGIVMYHFELGAGKANFNWYEKK